MKSDCVLVSGMLCLTVMAILASYLLGPDIGKWAIGAAMGIIATICGVNYHVGIRELKKSGKY